MNITKHPRIEEIIVMLPAHKNLIDLCQKLGIMQKELTPADHDYINEKCFKCCSCRWWYSKDEESEQGSGQCDNCEQYGNDYYN